MNIFGGLDDGQVHALAANALRTATADGVSPWARSIAVAYSHEAVAELERRMYERTARKLGER